MLESTANHYKQHPTTPTIRSKVNRFFANKWLTTGEHFRKRYYGLAQCIPKNFKMPTQLHSKKKSPTMWYTFIANQRDIENPISYNRLSQTQRQPCQQLSIVSRNCDTIDSYIYILAPSGFSLIIQNDHLTLVRTKSNSLYPTINTDLNQILLSYIKQYMSKVIIYTE